MRHVLLLVLYVVTKKARKHPFRPVAVARYQSRFEMDVPDLLPRWNRFLLPIAIVLALVTLILWAGI